MYYISVVVVHSEYVELILQMPQRTRNKWAWISKRVSGSVSRFQIHNLLKDWTPETDIQPANPVLHHACPGESGVIPGLINNDEIRCATPGCPSKGKELFTVADTAAFQHSRDALCRACRAKACVLFHLLLQTLRLLQTEIKDES